MILRRVVGDKLTPVGDYVSQAHSLDYPCNTGLPETAIRAAAAALRGNSMLLPSLRKRAVDVATRLGDLMTNNSEIRKGLVAIADGKPLKEQP